MRLGRVDRYTVDGVGFDVRAEYGPRLDYAEAVQGHQLRADATMEERLKTAQALHQAMRNLLRATVRAIENLEAEDGTPITEWSDDLWRLLPEPMLDELTARILASESDERRGNLPSGEQG